MNELNDILKEKIKRELEVCNTIGQVALFELVSGADNDEAYIQYNEVLFNLVDDGVIDIVTDKAESMNIVRLIQVYH